MNLDPALEFNARSLSPSEVAKSFVPPLLQYRQVVQSNNSIIIGPRGSGKTTLLKMLTIRALNSWNANEANEFSRMIRFRSAFVAADKAWGGQISSADQIDGTTDTGEAAFVIHTLISLLTAMRDSAVDTDNVVPTATQHLCSPLSPSQQSDVVKLIASQFDFSVVLPSFLGLELAFRKTLERMSPLADNREIPAFCRLHNFLSSVSSMISIFNDVSGNSDQKWALLFDELEIAPDRIRRFLIESLRSVDHRVVLKLALVPYLEFSSDWTTSQSPNQGHDYDIISLAYPRKDDAYSFSKTLADNIFAMAGISSRPLETVFDRHISGRSSPASSSDNIDFSKRASVLPEEFYQLSSRDISFDAYLKSHSLYSRKKPFNENEKATYIRKIMPVVQWRDFYVREFHNLEGSRRPQRENTLRSRKSHVLYNGYSRLLELTEGNPRTILTMFVPLVREAQALLASNERARIGPELQHKAIETVMQHSVALLRTVPISQPNTVLPRGLLGFVDQVGFSFQKLLLKSPFDSNYVGTFTLDSRSDDLIMKAVGLGLNTGALVYVPDDDAISDTIFSGLRGKRYRVSYTLAPRYSIIPTLGRAISLRELLGDRVRIVARDPEVVSRDLFHEGGEVE